MKKKDPFITLDPKIIKLSQSIFETSWLLTPVNLNQEKKKYSSSDLGDQLRSLIVNLGIKGWRVVITSRKITRISVNPAQEIISLKRGEKISLKDLKKIKAHEIETHFLRSVNGNLQPYKIFATQVIPGYPSCPSRLF